MKTIAVLDAETHPFKLGRVPVPFIWGFYDGETYEEFTDTAKVAEFLYDKELIVYAHHGGKFDWHFLAEYINQMEQITVINGRLAKFKIGLCECRDSYSILPVPLAAYEKEKIDYDIFEPDERYKPENYKRIKAYLYSDCINLYRMVTSFISMYGLHLTQAGASMKTWSKMAKCKPPQSTADYYHLFSPYYYGGRVECFKGGVINKKFSVFDINSAYPYAMLSQHPLSLTFDFDEYPLANSVVGHGFYHIKAVSRGAFPFRADDGGLYFPNDDTPRDYTITGWELIAARETGTVEHLKIISSRVHHELVSFADYIRHFYDLRLQAKACGDKENDLFSKLLMNSLYGKFGSNPENYQSFMLIDAEHVASVACDGYALGGTFGPHCVVSRDLWEHEANYYNVATAASITGFVRAYLWRALCGAEGVLYCDTDAIACVSPGNIMMGDALGEWKNEGDFNRSAIAGKKLYAFRYLTGEWKVRSKGVNLNARQICKVARGGFVDYANIAPTFSLKKGPVFVTRRVRATF